MPQEPEIPAELWMIADSDGEWVRLRFGGFHCFPNEAEAQLKADHLAKFAAELSTIAHYKFRPVRVK